MMVWNIQAGPELAKTDMSFDNYVANPSEEIQIDKNFNLPCPKIRITTICLTTLFDLEN